MDETGGRDGSGGRRHVSCGCVPARLRRLGQARVPLRALQASAGVYDDGSGRLGLALLATLRDGRGAGPDGAWTLALAGPGGSLVAQEAYPGGATPGSSASWWWPDEAPVAGPYDLTASGEGSSLPLQVDLPSGLGLAIPQLALSSDAGQISWPAVAGAASYQCQVYDSSSSLQLSTTFAAPGCDLSALLPGAYSASVLALSADLAALAANTSQRPALPARFDVAEARLALLRPLAGGAAVRAVAAGGALDSGSATRSLAIWLSISNADGTPTSAAWSVEVVGPNLPASAPLTFSYGPNLPRQLLWSYDVPASPGLYSFTATSTAGAIAGSFSVGTPPPLDIAQGVAASAGAQGSATVDWTPVTGALSYLASAWDHATGAFVAGAWVAAPPASFPKGTFAAGSSYDVYVDATDADMLGGQVPTQVAVSEDTYQPVTFAAQ